MGGRNEFPSAKLGGYKKNKPSRQTGLIQESVTEARPRSLTRSQHVTQVECSAKMHSNTCCFSVQLGNRASKEPLMATTNKPKSKTVYRSSVKGVFVTERYAKQHPDTTEKERIKIKPKQ